MKLTKDEARILAAILEDGKHTFNDSLNEYDRDKSIGNIRMIQKLQDKLEVAGTDERRFGRTSQNRLSDTIQRLKNKYHL